MAMARSARFTNLSSLICELVTEKETVASFRWEPL
jgi:hypothetical protein